MANRVDFYTENYDDIIEQKGIKCNWEQAIVCECLSEDSGQPDFNCPLCHGSGFRYLPAQAIRVVSSSFSSSVKLESLGAREPGTAYITPKSDIVMGYRDRLKFTDFKCKYSEAIRFTADSPYSSITYRNIRDVLFLIHGDDVYEPGIDFEICPDNHHLCWTNLETHPGNVTMSVLYMTTPCYLVVDLLHELRATYVERKVPTETFKEFPKQYQIRREDFVYGVSKPTPLPTPEVPAEPTQPEDESPQVTTGADSYDY